MPASTKRLSPPAMHVKVATHGTSATGHRLELTANVIGNRFLSDARDLCGSMDFECRRVRGLSTSASVRPTSSREPPPFYRAFTIKRERPRHAFIVPDLFAARKQVVSE
jgi:hypothetical protein